MPHGITRIVVQEQRALLRIGLAELLAKTGRFDAVDHVADVEELATVVALDAPDAVAVELIAPGLDRELVARLRSVRPDVRVVALHEGRRADHTARAKELGIDALAAYGGGAQALLAAIFDEPIVLAKLDERRQLPSRTVLTPRECEVLQHLAQGKTAAMAAASLRVSPKTIDNHKQRIFVKLGVQNQAHAVALAHRIGILGRGALERASSE